MKTLIKDFEQFKRFVDVLAEPEKDEVYFISLSARNKYLSADERLVYGLGRTEMFSRTIVRSKSDFEFAMQKLALKLEYKKTKLGLPIPEKALVVYVNIHPSSMVLAYHLFKSEMDNIETEVLRAFMNGKQPNYEAFKNADRHFMNAIQKSAGIKQYVDIDVDSKDFDLVQELTNDLNGYAIRYYVIKTHGGFHVLINREDLHYSHFRLHEVVERLNEEAKKYDGEVVFNKNAMVPFPGTMQAEKLVELL